MAKLIEAKAWCNNEVAYLAWKTNGKIDGCLGFMIIRVHLDTEGNEVERRVLPAWVAFKTQSNPDWQEQETSVWPIQKFSWRDLTLRKSRDQLATRSPDFKARYEIVPVGFGGKGRKPVPASPTAHPGSYKGAPIPLFFCGDPIQTDAILVTGDFGDLSVAFTNGILSTQNLRKQLETKPGVAPTKAQVQKHIEKPGDPIRKFLAGDVLPTLKKLFERADAEDGTLYLALYELADDELIEQLKTYAPRINLILSTAGSMPPKKGTKGPTLWDTENTDVRKALTKLLGKRMHNRWFNNSSHIGHNKFAVLVDKQGKPDTVWTGSTNWTPTGLCAQTNNTIVLRSKDVAQAYLDYWNRLLKDKLPTPKPPTAQLNCDQGPALRHADAKPSYADLNEGATRIEMWYSPNTPKLGTPKTRTAPPDLQVVFELMKGAKQAIFFLVFNPGRSDAEGHDVNTIVSAGIDFARLDPKLLVMGANSDPTAMPGYTAPPRGAPKDKSKPKPPETAIFTPDGASNVLIIRAVAIDDLIGDFQRELLSAGHAIIHDKIVAIDPLSEKDCKVITGSHNLGFKASYANDENMLIISGNRDLALAYVVHILDVVDHYKFRAVLAQQVRDAMLAGKPKPQRAIGKGFLSTDDRWQDPSLSGEKGDELAYFL